MPTVNPKASRKIAEKKVTFFMIFNSLLIKYGANPDFSGSAIRVDVRYYIPPGYSCSQ
jgi:hypothetical protein